MESQVNKQMMSREQLARYADQLNDFWLVDVYCNEVLVDDDAVPEPLDLNFN